MNVTFFIEISFYLSPSYILVELRLRRCDVDFLTIKYWQTMSFTSRPTNCTNSSLRHFQTVNVLAV